jgi:hypothetical protein
MGTSGAQTGNLAALEIAESEIITDNFIIITSQPANSQTHHNRPVDKGTLPQPCSEDVRICKPVTARSGLAPGPGPSPRSCRKLGP